MALIIMGRQGVEWVSRASLLGFAAGSSAAAVATRWAPKDLYGSQGPPSWLCCGLQCCCGRHQMGAQGPLRVSRASLLALLGLQCCCGRHQMGAQGPLRGLKGLLSWLCCGLQCCCGRHQMGVLLRRGVKFSASGKGLPAVQYSTVMYCTVLYCAALYYLVFDCLKRSDPKG